ncbi:hypothetical protein ABH15_12795 [Methanoculleus taiwanensis]|uniref:Uncharacterized protein n=1 Tax=Methanoculleus taiwanensis TaxID=1550565 RepID=A0A498GWX9_9EURY|nr:hypothetical protein [Methanoculleus taiwanensis]RXE55103.1 hypothetical protein ABH15_12795 [Methanoculleus taiwanensis]
MITENTLPRSPPGPHAWLTVPAVSIGGVLIGILLTYLQVPSAILIGVAGCVIASFILGYIAYSKPKRDIVSLFAPLYAVIIFLIPNDFSNGPVMQTLYAVSISILALRVEKRFSKPMHQEKTMKQFLNEYIARIEPITKSIDEETGHRLASSLLTFKFGLYKNAIVRCDEALGRLRETGTMPGALEAALMIVRERSEDLAESRVTPAPHYTFAESDAEALAIRLRPEDMQDKAALDLDNALVLLYAVSIETSPEDEQALEEHQRFVIQILEAYKEQLAE